MLLSAVSVLVVAQSSSEIPEGLMNNPVLMHTQQSDRRFRRLSSLFIGIFNDVFFNYADYRPVGPYQRQANIWHWK